eukprot:s1050_g4.t2
MLFAYPGAINDNHPVCGTQPEFLAPPPQLHITAVAIGRQVAPAVSMFELGLELEDQTPQIKTGPQGTCSFLARNLDIWIFSVMSFHRFQVIQTF